MSAQCLTIERREQLNMSNGLATFTELLASRAQQWGTNFATTFRKTTIASEVQKDTRTVTRYVNQLKDLGLAEVESKRGRNGGTVVLFNKDLLNFEPTNNPITSDTKEASEIREQVFPTVPKKEPKRHYRTKAQIAEERALQSRQKRGEERLNDLLEPMNVVTRDFFDNFDNPELAFNGYLLAQMYNAYAVIYPKRRQQMFADKDADIANSAEKAFNRALSYRVLPKRFVGTPQYNKFMELASFLMHYNINPLSYLTVQFDHAEWLGENGKARRGAIPYINTLLSGEAIDRFSARERFIKEQRKKGLFGLSTEKVPFIGAKYPTLIMLMRAFQGDKYAGDNMDIIIDKLVNPDVFNVSPTRIVLANYYTTVMGAIEESSLTEDHKKVLTKFIKEQVALYAPDSSIASTAFTLMAPLQINTIRTTMQMNNFTTEEYYSYLGNIHKSKLDEDWDLNVEQGEAIDFCYNANVTFMNTNRMLADYHDLGVAPHELRNALTEFGVEKVPLDRFGFLDVDRIYGEILTADQLREEKERLSEMREFTKFY